MMLCPLILAAHLAGKCQERPGDVWWLYYGRLNACMNLPKQKKDRCKTLALEQLYYDLKAEGPDWDRP